MTSSGKRKAFSVEEKLKIVRKIENGSSQANMCREFSLSKSTVATIWKNRDALISANEKNLNAKKLRKPERENVDEALLKWFTLQRNRNLPVSGPMLQSKAEEFAKLFNETGFTCSNGWLDRFKKRNNISCAKIIGESANVSTSDVQHWKENVWSDASHHYNEKDIFNADEAGLFYKMKPNQTLKFKGDKCAGGKLSKVRFTVLVCANMSGTEKRKLVVIGNAQKPRCFSNVKKLPVEYKSNRKAWMTSEIFEEELRKWDKELSGKKRKILLLVDNCTAHNEVQNLKSIKIVFLPPNTTSVIQPMDQGVIRSLKSHYRKQLIMRLLECYDKNIECNISLLDGIIMIEKSWQLVTESTIRNCFQHAGLSIDLQDVHMNPSEQQNEDDDENLPLAMWLEKNGIAKFDDCEGIELFETYDDELVTSEYPTDEDIVTSIKDRNDDVDDASDTDEEGVSVEEDLPSVADARAAMTVVNRFLSTQNIEKKVSDSFLIVEKEVDKLYLQSRTCQKKITDYLCNQVI